MENITNPSILRLARRAGISSVNEDSYDTIRAIIMKKLEEIINTVLIVNAQHNTKTIMTQDIYDALELLNEGVARTNTI